MPQSRSRVVLFIVIFLAVAAFPLIWWKTHSNGAGASGQAARMRFLYGGPLPVIVAAAKQGDINLYINGLGAVTPLVTDTLQSQISGQLLEVDFKEGEEVKKGQLLAVIDPRPYQVALEQAEGQLQEAQAALKDAQLDLKRYQDLVKQDSIAQQQVDTQQATVLQDEGVIKVDQAAIDNAKLNLTYCHITAPVDGVVGLRQVDPGNYVTPNLPNGLVVLTQIKPITVEFTLPEDDIPEVISRLHAGQKLAVDAFDRSETTKLASGVLTSVDNEVDPSTGTIKMRATFPNEDESLYPSQFVNARLQLGVLHDVTVIPTSAIERGEQGTFVYLIQQGPPQPEQQAPPQQTKPPQQPQAPQGIAVARPVQLGATEGERVQVLSGLEEGDLVVVDGADRLKEGMPVAIQKASDANPSTGVPKGGRHHKGKGANGWGGSGGGGWGGKR